MWGLQDMNKTSEEQQIIDLLTPLNCYTREEIAMRTGMPEKTITWRVRDLMKKGIIKSHYLSKTKSGRMAETLGIDHDA